MQLNHIYEGEAKAILATLPDNSVDCCVTSPPYFGLRDYGVPGQLGLEKTPEEYVKKMVEIFREVRRVLKPEGTLWLNLGDSYASGKGSCLNPGGGVNSLGRNRKVARVHPLDRGNKSTLTQSGLKSKDLIGIPWMVAFALRSDGWYLRQDIIWHKPNPMPESVRDRCTKSHEYIFLLSKSRHYYYDAKAIKTPLRESSVARLSQAIENQTGSTRVPGKTNGKMKAVRFGGNKAAGYGTRIHSGNEWKTTGESQLANKKSVWKVATKPYRAAHFATFPPELIVPCILAGCRPNGVVLDPFMGSGTTAEVCLDNDRNYIGIELNSAFVALSHQRLEHYLGMKAKKAKQVA